MQSTTRIASCTTVSALLALFAAAPASAANTKLQGTISWTTTATTIVDTPGEDAFTAKETRTVTLKVRMTKRAGAFGWQPEDNGSSYSGRYTLSSTRLERDITGATICTTTHGATGSGSGRLPKKPRSTTAPSLFGSILPSTASLGSQTKALILGPILRYRGKDTVTSTGSGLNPCQGGQDVDPVDVSFGPTDSADRLCYPSGTSKRTTTPQAGSLLGTWKVKTRSFAFACSDSWKEPEGKKLAVNITGSLKLS